MNINFFEEYPTPENIAKLDLITWPMTVLMAAPSLWEFENIRALYTNQYPNITFGWWPTIPGSYWVSGFSNPQDLEHLFAELTTTKQVKELPILIDLELPIMKPSYFKNSIHLRKNKKLIREFARKSQEYNLKVYTAEYPAPGKFFRWLARIFGISLSLSIPHTKLPMLYSSMGEHYFGSWLYSCMKRFESNFTRKHPDRTGFGLGTIAIGVLGNEPILSPEKLGEDLGWAKNSGVKEVFIFRLGGLDETYQKVISNFVSS